MPDITATTATPPVTATPAVTATPQVTATPLLTATPRTTATTPTTPTTAVAETPGTSHATATPPATAVAGTPVFVIGGGPGGLAVAAALRERGLRSVVVEKSGGVGGAWRGHYDRLRLHTTRKLSALPGLAIPRAYGRWVKRDDMVRYLEDYAEHHRLEIVTGVEVTRIERRSVEDGARTRWLLRATGGRELAADAVIVATGFNHTPYVPDWPGRDGFRGELLHAAHYRNAEPYRDRDVLVVGTGNTGADIAVDLAKGGASRVRLAVRTAPHIVRRSTVGWPVQRSGILMRRMPRWAVDRAARMAGPDLAAYGMPRPETGLSSRVREGATPVLDAGLAKAVRKRKVQPVAAVGSFDHEKVVLTDGTVLTPDVVVAATGYRRGLEDLVGHLDVLDERGRPRVNGRRSVTPGLHFTGYTTPISGMLRELALDARRIAHALDREDRRRRRGR
ncbi:NAD(P)/FAD-dependent oxidoreductase [Streptomyces sp. NPDC047108]|uniref:flavin-containing monooxygenase n=1 Tax=Streptomyces sp. NPDC047108 TaxID=3155025 RepID=UPI0033FD92E2